jgi:4-amino-4-deoxy-L-arabinose transferase-like glycosyltransferase
MVTAPQSPANARWPMLAFAAVLALATAIVVASLPSAVVDASSDDGYYLAYMKSVHESGLSVFPKLFDAWNADEHAWIYPPPSRVGFIAASAAWAAVFGASFSALQWLSIAAYVAGSIATYFFARRQFGEPRALFIGALWVFSPLLMGLSRLALTDSFIALCMSVTAWLFLELVEEPDRWSHRILFMSAFAFTVLVKELSVLLALPFGAFVLIERFARRERLSLATFALVLALPGALALPLFVAAAGSFSTLLATTRIVLASPATNEYAIKYGSGPWFRYVVDYLCLSPCTTLLAVAYLGVIVLKLRDGDHDKRLSFLALLAALTLVEYSFFTKNLRYAVLLELPIRVFSVGMLWQIAPGKTVLRRMVSCGAAVAILCWIDARAFDLYWIRNRGYDPVTLTLVGARQIIPFALR